MDVVPRDGRDRLCAQGLRRSPNEWGTVGGAPTGQVSLGSATASRASAPRRAAEKRAMTFRCSALVAVLCACAAHGAETDYSKLKIVTLKRMLFVRGVECTHCTTKDEWASHMQLHSELPEREELAAEWVAQKEYAKKAKELSMTRDEFLKQMNETEGVRAGRLWAVRAHATRTPRARHARAK